MEGGRFKSWTDGNTNQAILGVEGLKQEDEGAYKCVLNGEIEHEFSVYVTVEGGMDFRAMLMKKKKPQKKVVEKFEWIEEPSDRSIRQGTCDEISFTCKLSHKGKKAKWYLRNQQTRTLKQAHPEHGLECYKGKKFGFIVDDDVFTLIIKNPE